MAHNAFQMICMVVKKTGLHYMISHNKGTCVKAIHGFSIHKTYISIKCMDIEIVLTMCSL